MVTATTSKFHFLMTVCQRSYIHLTHKHLQQSTRVPQFNKNNSSYKRYLRMQFHTEPSATAQMITCKKDLMKS